MIYQRILIQLLGLCCLCLISCQTNGIKNSEIIDLSPKTSKYLNQQPNSLAYYIGFDGNSYNLKNTNSGLAKIVGFELSKHVIQIQNNQEKAFAYQLIDSDGNIVFNDIVSVPIMLRTNYLNESNNAVLHEEAPLSNITIPIFIDIKLINESNPPTKINIMELELYKGKLIPSKKTKQGQIKLKKTTKN